MTRDLLAEREDTVFAWCRAAGPSFAFVLAGEVAQPGDVLQLQSHAMVGLDEQRWRIPRRRPGVGVRFELVIDPGRGSPAVAVSGGRRRSGSRTSAKIRPVGWEALAQWGDDVARIEPLAGGVANEVWSVRLSGRLAVGRLGARSDADLAWETDLLGHLDREGLTVPVPIPTADGRLFADGLVVMTYVEGRPPEAEADWRRVADTLRQLHRLTQGWPQRPGWRSSTDLLHAETGTKIDLGAMPPEGVARCRAAWARLAGRQTCVVHGNPNNPGNVRMTANRVALIDWDESHVDVPDLDLVLPYKAAGLDDSAHDIAAQASAAWEAAVCWDDDYAVKRLADVRAV